MTTLVLAKPGRWTSREEPAPTAADLAAGEALLRVRALGVCGTDLHAFRGTQPFFTYPRVLGHELGVEVVAVAPDVSRVRPGDRCAVRPYYSADADDQAVRRGLPNCGDALRVLGVHVDGGMRPYLRYRADALHPSATLDYDRLALAEPLAIGRHAADRAGATAADQVLIIGAGPIGLATALFVAESGARLLVADLAADKIAQARRLLTGAETLVVPPGGLPPGVLRGRLGGDLPTVVIDATGHAGSMNGCVDLAAPGGTVVFVGLHQGEVRFTDTTFHKKELTLRASRAALPEDFERVIRALEDGSLDPRPLITHRLAFGRVATDFTGLYELGDSLTKAIIDFPAP